jgi:hypothetical protein
MPEAPESGCASVGDESSTVAFWGVRKIRDRERQKMRHASQDAMSDRRAARP